MFVLRTDEPGDPRVRFSPSGQFLLVWEEVWSLAERARVHREPEGILGAGEWSPVADELCVPRDNVLKIVTPRGEPIQTVEGAGWVRGVAFAPKGDWLVTFSPFVLTGWKRVRGKWRSRWTAEVKKTGPLKNDSFESVTAFPDGRRVLTLTTRRHVRDGYTPYRVLFVLRDAKTGEVLGEQPLAEEDGPLGVHTRLAVTPDGSRVIGFRARSVLAWPAAPPSGRASRTPVSKKDVQDVALHPSGRWVLVANNSPEVSVWDTTTWKPVRTLDWKIGPVECAAISADGQLAAVANESGKAAVWDWDL